MSRVVDCCLEAKEGAMALATTSLEVRNNMLLTIADAIILQQENILKANKIDLEQAQQAGKDSAFLDRLALNPNRVIEMSEGVRQIVNLPDPIGVVTRSWEGENGLKIKKVSAPLGSIAIIYEARPNVTADATALCIKSGNAVILKGSRDSANSNKAIFDAMKDALTEKGFDSRALQLIEDKSRESTARLLKQGNLVDVVIPRGGDKLKQFVLDNANMPVIASAGGNCHTYIEKTAKLDMATDIVLNAKLSRPSTCNACEQLLVHSEIAQAFLSIILPKLAEAGVEIRGCEITKSIYAGAVVAEDSDYYKEHHGYVISVKVLNSTAEAIAWVNKHGTKHSEAIVTEDLEAAQAFLNGVDAACVYVNASTRFTDGFQFGFGAEMGISTQKLHARGPLGLKELTSEKYIIEGTGQIRK